MKTENNTFNKSKELLDTYNEKMWESVSGQSDVDVQHLIIDKMDEILAYSDNKTISKSFGMKGIKFKKEDYVRLIFPDKFFMNLPDDEFICKGVGYLTNLHPTRALMYGMRKGGKQHEILFFGNIELENVNKVFETLIKYM